MRVDGRHVRLPGGFSPPPPGVHPLLAAGVVAVALWLLGLAWFGAKAAQRWVGEWQATVALHAYLPQARADQAETLADEMRRLAGAGSVRVVSAEEAAKRLREMLGAALPEKPIALRLPITIEVRPASSAFSFASFAETARRYGAEVNAHEAALWKLAQRLGAITEVLGWIAAAVAAGLAVVVGNTLRMLMLARQDEITLMRLFGAAEWFVRMPYLVEGTMLGAGAGGVAWMLMLISLHVFGAPPPQPLGMLATFVGGGVVIGAVGAWIATLGVGEEA